MKQHNEDVKETVVERYLRDEVQRAGGRSMKFVSPAHRGRTDQIVIYDNAAVFVEVKTIKGKLSALQIDEHKKLLKHYDKVTTVYGKGGVDKFMSDLVNDRHIAREYRP